MKYGTPVLSLFVLLALGGCASTAPTPQFNVEVRSEPDIATVVFRGQEIGETPVSFTVASFDELVEVAAQRQDKDAVEKRIRLLSPDNAEVIFQFDIAHSAMAQALGLTKILVFDYSERAAFDTDSHELKPEFSSMLESQAKVLNSSFSGLDVYVCGHTDSTGSADHNMVLSVDRAKAVSAFLLEHGVEKSRLKTQGFASDYPLAPNATPEGRGLNRRTEVILPQ